MMANNKNILITLPFSIDPISGGVPRVYWNLVPALREAGYNVYATYNVHSDCDKDNVYTDVFYMGDRPRYTAEYIKQFDDVISKWNINTVICLIYWDYVDYFSRRDDLSVFYHVHSTPHAEFCHTPSFFPHRLLGTWLEKIAKKIDVRYRFFSSFRRIKKNGQKIILLSDGYRKELLKIYPFKDANVTAITNPIVFHSLTNLSGKDKSILYVGRLNEFAKRFSSVLNIWKKVQNDLADFRLDIVGDSPSRKEYENKARSLDLRDVNFYGFQDPTHYYEKASCLLLTSNYEGFGMVLVEAMQYGCVPFAFDSFAAVHDIIDNGVNGYIIPPFDEDMYAQRLLEFIQLPEERKTEMRQRAYEKAKTFSVEKIAQKWLKLLDS